MGVVGNKVMIKVDRARMRTHEAGACTDFVRGRRRPRADDRQILIVGHRQHFLPFVGGYATAVGDANPIVGGEVLGEARVRVADDRAAANAHGHQAVVGSIQIMGQVHDVLNRDRHRPSMVIIELAQEAQRVKGRGEVGAVAKVTESGLFI